jgi:septal ring factor EnvC (AmiA/AmiB activator)
MIHQGGLVCRTVVGLRRGCWVLMVLALSFGGGCARVTPGPDGLPSDLQITADSLKTAVREAQRTASELRAELEEQRKDLADAHVARAQLQGMLQETERRLADARQVIELQREELASAHTERVRAQRLLRCSAGPSSRPNGARLQRKRDVTSPDPEAGPAPRDTRNSRS